MNIYAATAIDKFGSRIMLFQAKFCPDDDLVRRHFRLRPDAAIAVSYVGDLVEVTREGPVPVVAPGAGGVSG